jgi:hypothetical protein
MSPEKSDQEYFSLQSIPGKGKGLVAIRAIEPGTCILSEEPLLTTACITSIETQEKDLATALRSLSKDGQRAFLSLHNNHPGKNPLSNIIRTNAYPLGPNSDIGGLFPKIARINHSCLPNTQHSWNSILQKQTVYVVRPISEGDEITLSYSAGGPSKIRKATLKEYFGFDCTCNLCSLPPAKLAASDARWSQMETLDAAIGNPKRVMMAPDKALADCKKLFAVYKKEGVADTRIPRLWYDAFQICAMHGDQARCRVFARKGAESRVLCQGEISEDARSMTELSEDPKKAENFEDGMWKSGPEKAPTGLSEEAFEKWLWRET